jgi:amino acid adenylation domain-containing protein
MVDLTDLQAARLSPEKRLLLERLARARRPSQSDATQLARRTTQSPAALSFAQERMWLIDRLQPGNPLYNTCEAWRLIGPLQVDALKQALNDLLERQDALRTRILEAENGLVQAPASTAFPVEEIDLASLPESLRGTECDRRLKDAMQRAFDLAVPPMARAVLLRLGEDEHVLLVVMHHIAADGWSRAIFRRELAQAYAARLHGHLPDWAPLHLQYSDYSEWQRCWLSGGVLEGQLGYWRERLRGLSPLDLPADRPRPACLSYRGDLQRLDLPADLVAALKALARQHNATLYMVLLAAFQVLLMRYSGQEDIAVGTPVAGRNRPELEGLIGFFVNTLVMRGDLGGNPRFVDLLARTRQHALDAYAHQDLPFEKLVEALKPERDMSRNPLFQVMFVLQNTPEAGLRLPGLESERLPLHNGTAKFDLSFSFTEAHGVLHGHIEYSSDLFDPGRIQRLARHYRCLLEHLAAAPDTPVWQLPLLDTAERQVLLHDWNATTVAYPDHQGIAQRFEEQVRQRPDAIAVQFRQQHLDYAELNRQANRLAHHLRSLGIGADSLVGLCLERSLDMVVGMLAILKAGGAYVPLDPDYPQARLDFMLQDTGAAVVLTQAALQDRLPQVPHLLCLDSDPAQWSAWPDDDPAATGGPDDLAYVIYTSGSTGLPKGVMVTQQGIGNHMHWMEAEFAFSPGDAVLQKTSISSDASVWEFLAPLLTGGRLVMAEPGAHRDPAYLARAVREHGISLLQVVPVMLRALVTEPEFRRCSSLRMVYAGGEALECDLLETFRQHCTAPLCNLYGPTEVTIDSHFRVCGEESSAVIPIGRPIFNTRCYVLDAHDNPSPIGVAGELCIGGAGLARGYLRRPELTAERFIASPFQTGDRLYRTGDRVRWREDGVIEFLGRIDHQMKLRGYRIEPGEIEAVLQADPAIRQSLVVVREDRPGDRRLVAYLVGQGIDLDATRACLKARLPDYMIPGALVVLDSLPLTANGKVDRQALPVPGQAAGGPDYQAPRSPIETTLADIWADTLKLPRVGIHDNFFDLGGHSLLAAQTMNRINRELGMDVALRQVFDTPTVCGLASAVLEQKLPGRRKAGTQAIAAAILPRQLQGEPCELSFAQNRLWLVEHLNPMPGNYNISRVYRISGALNPVAVQAALDALVARHEVLRTRLVQQGGAPRQVIDPQRAVEMQKLDARVCGEVDSATALDAFIRNTTRGAFDLSAGCMLRAGLARLGDAEWMLAITMHHIASDGWSMDVLDREFETLYAGFDSGSPAALPPLHLQYSDYSEWQRCWLSGGVLEGQLGYWRERLRGLSPLDLPADRPRPACLSYRGDLQRLDLPADLVAALKALARQHNATLYMVLLAAFQVLLMRYSGQEDIAVGTPVAGRNRPELEGLIGFFVNTLVMRGDLGGNPRFVDLLARTRQHALDAYAHQDLPFEKLVEALKPERDMSRNPLFQVMFVLQNTPEAGLRLPGLESERLPLHNGTAKFDLSFSFTEAHGVLHGHIEYSSDLFDPGRIQRLARHYRCLLEHLAAAPDTPVWQLPLLDTAERQVLLHDWNATTVAYPDHQGIAQRFEEQVRQRPDAIAVQFRQQHLDYAELNRQANRLAHHLRSLGIGADSLVGLCLERSLDMVVGMLAILKAGGAYVPLDPDYPQARLDFMLQDTGAAVVLTQAALQDRLPQVPHLLCLDSDPAQWSAWPDDDPAATGGPDDLAYVIYTSGSTGLPKGVMVTQQGIGNHMHWMEAEFAFSPGDAVLQKTSISSDASVWEFLAPLLTGGRLVMAEPGAHRDPAYLARAVREHGISLLQVVPVMLRALVTEPEFRRCSSLRMVYAGGEALECDLLETFRQHCTAPLCNLYGPTEVTIDSHFRVCGEESSAVIPIGRPIFNTRCYVLDAHDNPSPIGVAGELCIGGAGLARGYLRRPELTAERFIASPFQTGDRLYRTGDRVRWREDGVIEFLGRIDHQMKLRGYRIEPGEIEAVLQADPAIRQSLVVVREDRPGDRRLVAYLVGQGIDLDATRACLKARLPDYMIPGALVVLDSLPLTANGKVDRQALPVPGQAAGGPDYQAPRSPIETTLADIWADTLKLPRVGIHDNFFDLGGHSLLAVQLIERIQQALGNKPHLNTLWYGAGSIAQQARLLTGVSPDKTGPVLVMRPGGDAPALFCLHTIGGGNLFHYEPMVSHLGADRPVYGLQARGIDGKCAPDTSVEAMARYCIDSMRRIQPDGPYLLCGFSSGGLVAYEMACCLAEEGVEARLFLVDSFTSNYPESWRSHWTRWNRLFRDKRVREIQERVYYSVLSQLGLGRLRKLRGLGESHRWAMWSYRPRRSDLSAIYFEASERISGLGRPSPGWVPLLGGGLTLHVIPGGHGDMVKGENAAVLAEALSACLSP